MVNENVNKKGISRDKIVLFLDNAAAHTSNYAIIICIIKVLKFF